MKDKSYYLKILPACLLSAMLFLNQSSPAQTLRRPVAAPYLGFGVYSPDHGDVFSFIVNQASLAGLKNIAAGIYGERRFLLTELNNYTAAIGLPTHSGNVGMKAVYSGFSEYSETQLGLAYARNLGSKMDIGVQFNYTGIRIAGYGNASAISFEAGGIFHLSDKLHTGFHINNPVGGKFGKDQQEKLPSVYTMGWGYDASAKFFFNLELVKEEDQPINVGAGLQYQFIPQLLVRAGMSSATSTAWIGFGFQFTSIRVDVAASYHPQLGMTPGLLLLFNAQPKAN
jgi:hypothetical protein